MHTSSEMSQLSSGFCGQEFAGGAVKVFVNWTLHNTNFPFVMSLSDVRHIRITHLHLPLLLLITTQSSIHFLLNISIDGFPPGEEQNNMFTPWTVLFYYIMTKLNKG